MKFFKYFFRSFLGNGRCAVCEQPLQAQEKDICIRCLSNLPYTNLLGTEENKLEKYFWGQIPIERATSLFTYYRGARSHEILRLLKYKNNPSIGVTFGRIMAEQLLRTSFFSTIDAIVPVPLSKERRKVRGYNQSESLAEGISEVTSLPIITEGINRIVSNVTQTRLSRLDRRNNVKGIFEVVKPERFVGKHLLLVDDVVTSASTLIELANSFKKCENIRFSILTLAMSASITEVPYYPEDNDDEADIVEDVITIPFQD